MTFSNRRTARLFRAGAIGAALISAAACGDKAAKERAAADSDLSRDLALANAQPQQQPTFQDTAVAPTPTPAAKSKKPETPAPVKAHVSERPRVEQPRAVAQTPPPQQQQAPAPAPAPVAAAPAPAPAPASIGAGTNVSMTSGSKVCTTNQVGDKLVATVSSPITGTNGAVIPAGSSVVLEVASVNPGDDANGASINFRVRAVVVNDKQYPVTGDVLTLGALDKVKVDNPDPNADKKKVIGGAIVGGILGQMIGHNTKGTVIGAAAGAAAGVAASKATQKYQSCLPQGSSLRLTINSPIVMS